MFVPHSRIDYPVCSLPQEGTRERLPIRVALRDRLRLEELRKFFGAIHAVNLRVEVRLPVVVRVLLAFYKNPWRQLEPSSEVIADLRNRYAQFVSRVPRPTIAVMESAAVPSEAKRVANYLSVGNPENEFPVGYSTQSSMTWKLRSVSHELEFVEGVEVQVACDLAERGLRTVPGWNETM
jgi:hypothetical protein